MDINEHSDDEQFLADIAAYLETQELLLLPALTSRDGDGTDRLRNVCETALPLGVIAADVSSSSSDSNTLQTLSQQQQQSRATVQPSAIPVAAAAPRRQPRVRNASRERMQSELKQLRIQSTELATQLAALRAHTAPRTSSSSSQHERLLLAAWASTAKRQFELRTRAELENMWLKQQLESHTALIEALQTVLVHSQSGASVPIPPPSVPAVAVHIRLEDVILYRQLLSELDGAWTRMDRVLDDSRLGSLHRSHDARSLQSFSHASMKARCGVRDGLSTDALPQYIELTSAETMPFEHEAVFRVNWECWERQGDAKGQVKIEHVPLGVNASVVQLTLSLNGVSVPMRILHVARVYHEAHRISYVWRSVTSAASHFPGVVIDETGWQTMTTTTADLDGAGEGVCTKILMCVHLESKAQSNEHANAAQQTKPSRVSPLVNLVISAVDAEELEVNDMMRRMLLEDAHAHVLRTSSDVTMNEASV